jgi:hypothetical protein
MKRTSSDPKTRASEIPRSSLPKRLSPFALAIFERRHAVVEKKSRATPADLETTLKKYGYPISEGVLAFEAAFGGLKIPEYGAKANWLEAEEPAWLLGAHACLTSEVHGNPWGGSKRRGLVPVAYSPNDVIYFLDRKGRGFVQDTIEDTRAVPFAANGLALVERLLFWDEMFMLESVSLEGALGDKLKTLLALTLLNDASAKDVRFFCSDTVYVTETAAKGKTAAQTVIACKTKKQLASIQKLII